MKKLRLRLNQKYIKGYKNSLEVHRRMFKVVTQGTRSHRLHLLGLKSSSPLQIREPSNSLFRTFEETAKNIFF